MGPAWAAPARHIKLEVSRELKHDGPGVLSMARSASPDSASSQFYFTLAAAPHLDMGYAAFGQRHGGSGQRTGPARRRQNDQSEGQRVKDTPPGHAEARHPPRAGES